VRDYHKKFGLPLDMGNPPEKVVKNRLSFIEEEFSELKFAVAQNDRVKILDAIADILGVTYGMAAEYGFDADEAFDRVCKSNMSKDKPVDGIGKLVKGKNYIPVDLKDLAEG
jgi:predicted HAD superfamily Cof-like phosphohydrolase